MQLRVWEKYIGETLRSQCACCEAPISVVDFACGRVTCSANGGSSALDNLRPVCVACEKLLRNADMTSVANIVKPKAVKAKTKKTKVTTAVASASAVTTTTITTATAPATASATAITGVTTPARSMRKTIPKPIRIKVWETYIGDTVRGMCTCCAHEQISFNNFDCAHVVSVAHGGENTLANLRPVCSSCNKSMGAMNFDDFKHILEEALHPVATTQIATQSAPPSYLVPPSSAAPPLSAAPLQIEEIASSDEDEDSASEQDNEPQIPWIFWNHHSQSSRPNKLRLFIGSFSERMIRPNPSVGLR
jgi:hypothetical protein